MSKIEKLLSRFLNSPSDFTWEELKKILTHFGYIEMPNGISGGSRRKFVDNDKNVISLHKPHPKNILKRYVIKLVTEHLIQHRKIKP